MKITSGRPQTGSNRNFDFNVNMIRIIFDQTLSKTKNNPKYSQPEKQGHSNGGGGGGGFLRSLFCCFTGPHHGNRRYSEVDQNDEPKDEPKNPKAPLIPDDPVEPELHIVSYF